MAANTKIEWTDHTFNPWVGCTKVSPACDNCYAEDWAKRYNAVSWGPHHRKRTSVANWRKPLQWNASAKASGMRPRVFCASLADVFDNDGAITSGWHGDLWSLIDQTPNLDWMLLTKRPQNIKKMLPETYGMPAWGQGWKNVWLGTTAENQVEADRRIPHLLDIPAVVHFASAEPLLEWIDFGQYLHDSDCDHISDKFGKAYQCTCEPPHEHKLNLIIAGGESGPNARPMHPDWVRGIRDQCVTAGAAFFMKQWGEWAWASDDKNFEDAERHAKLNFGKNVKIQQHSDGRTCARVGKKRAGNTLDGQTWQQMPEVK